MSTSQACPFLISYEPRIYLKSKRKILPALSDALFPLLSLWTNATRKESIFTGFVIRSQTLLRKKKKKAPGWFLEQTHITSCPLEKPITCFQSATETALSLDSLAMKRGYPKSPSASVEPPQSRTKYNPNGNCWYVPWLWFLGWVLRLIWERLAFMFEFGCWESGGKV